MFFGSKPKRTKPLVLHIDDEVDILGFVGLAIREIGVDVESASTAADGIRKAASEKPELVILDIMMPGTDGFETCRAIKQKSPGTKVLMMSALAQMRDVEKALAQGADGYITKPVSIQKLREKVREALNIPAPLPENP
jgi:DNA-binding response OmpR family regulator